MTLFKLSLRNAKRQACDYLVYFVTIVMAAALIHAFNNLVFSEEIRNLSDRMDSLTVVVVLTSVVVIGIIGWLVSYTTRFMLKRRSRELGTYILIGLENKQVARLFFVENIVVGAFALLIGIILGNLVFQALRAAVLSLFHVSYTFSFAFLPQAVLLSLLYFALIYLLALAQSRRTIRKMKIHDLLYYDRQNEEGAIQKEQMRRKIFVISILLGIVGAVLILLRNLMTGLIGAAMIIAFLYGFFISFSSGVPAYFNRRPEKKFKGHTLLVFRTLTAKLATMGVVMATISVLLTGTLIAEGSGMVFNSLFQSRTEQNTCFDLFIGSTDQTEEKFDAYLNYVEAKIPVRKDYRYDIYQSDSAQVTEFIEEKIEDYIREFDYDTFMRASDYHAVRAMLGYSEVELPKGQYGIHCMPYLKKLLTSYNQTIQVGGQILEAGAVYDESFNQSLWDGNGRGFVLIVPDETLAGQPVSHSIYAAMTERPVSEAAYQELRLLRDDKDWKNQGYDTILTLAAVEAENAVLYATLVFPLYYLALVLTMVSATILTIQQLSETSHYRRQFQLLHDLGMERREMLQTLRKQFAIFYLMPALPPILIGVPFIAALSGSLDAGILSGPGQMVLTVALALGLFIGIYLIYILAAYASLKRNVLPNS